MLTNKSKQFAGAYLDAMGDNNQNGKINELGCANIFSTLIKNKKDIN
jgi:hypothetical protein